MGIDLRSMLNIKCDIMHVSHFNILKRTTQNIYAHTGYSSYHKNHRSQFTMFQNNSKYK